MLRWRVLSSKERRRIYLPDYASSRLNRQHVAIHEYIQCNPKDNGCSLPNYAVSQPTSQSVGVYENKWQHVQHNKSHVSNKLHGVTYRTTGTFCVPEPKWATSGKRAGTTASYSKELHVCIIRGPVQEDGWHLATKARVTFQKSRKSKAIPVTGRGGP
jgi:hypothetical protein